MLNQWPLPCWGDHVALQRTCALLRPVILAGEIVMLFATA